MIRSAVFPTLLLLSLTSVAYAQDPVKVDPRHYKVVYEDETIRMLRLNFGPHEKSVMHEHPNGTCVVFLTEFHGKSTAEDRKVTTYDSKAGEASCEPMQPGMYRHLPENVADKPQELIVIERKQVKTP